MKRWVTNDVWRELDPLAGRLSRRSVRRLRATAVAVVVGALVWHSGLVAPQLAYVGDNDGYSWAVEPTLVGHEVVITNNGWTPMTVVGVGRSGPGLQLVSVASRLFAQALDPEPPPALTDIFPAEVRSGGLLRVMAVYRITDCSAIPRDPWPVPVRVKRAWGVQTIYIGLPERAIYRPSSYSDVGEHDPNAVEWQRAISAKLCNFG